MKKLTTIATVLALCVAGMSCKKETIGDGPITSATRNVHAFTAIDLQMNGNVYFTPSTERKVEVTAKESLHGKIETTVVNGKLVIRYNNGRIYDEDETIRISISGPGVNRLAAHTTGNIFVMANMSVPQLYLHTGGAGKIMLKNVTADYIEAAAYLSGGISATGGAVTNENLRAEGSGDVEFGTVAAKTAYAYTKASGDISVRASDQLEVKIDGSGSVYFSGYPQVTTHINGSGKLIRF